MFLSVLYFSLFFFVFRDFERKALSKAAGQPGTDGRTPPDHPGRTDGQEKLGKTLFYFIFPYF